MQNKSILLFFSVLFYFGVKAQDKILMTIDDHPVYASEFKRVYLKNIDLVKDDSQKDIDEYLDLFINYKLKLKEAFRLNLDKKDSYVKELSGYKEQLSSNYLTDSKATDALIQEAYDRSMQRVKASHILIKVAPDASAQDTIKAYNKIKDLLTKIIKGADFEAIAKEFSQDPSAVKNGGALGWFSAFRMVYEFETAAYTTAVGEVSEPFRTQFGYHIVKVQDRQKALGEVEVAHIMVAKNAQRTIDQAGTRIQEIKKQLTQGASFESLAREYSDDRNTAVNGGKINKFAQGALNSIVFENTAFALESPGQISEPIKTKYGWHILKLITKFPPKPFKEQKKQLSQMVKRDNRSQLVTDAFMNSLRKKYGVLFNTDAITYFEKTIPSTVLNENWELPDSKMKTKLLFSIKDTSYTYQDFATYLVENGFQGRKMANIPVFVKKMYEDFESEKLLGYYKEHLEEDNKDFANILEEYRDGLLLFDLMQSRVWNAAKDDSLGVKEFYETRKQNYIQGEKYVVLKASSTDQNSIDSVKELLEKNTDLDGLKKNNSIKNVLFSEDEIEKGKDRLPKDFVAIKGAITQVKEDDYITLIKVQTIIPEKIKTLEEAKGRVINDYQEEIEKLWLQDLRTKYQVEVNKKTLKKVKKELVVS